MEKYRERSLYGDDLDLYYKGSHAAKQNGHVMKMKHGDAYYPEMKPLKADLSRFPVDYHTHLDSLSKPSEYGDLKWGYQRASSSSPLDYSFQLTPSRTVGTSRCSKESLAYSESDWGPSFDEYDRRPKSSYLHQTSPQPAMRQRSKSGSGLQEPMMPFGASAFKTHSQGHSYNSYTYPRLSEPTMCIPKVRSTTTSSPRVTGHTEKVLDGQSLGSLLLLRWEFIIQILPYFPMSPIIKGFTTRYIVVCHYNQILSFDIYYKISD